MHVKSILMGAWTRKRCKIRTKFWTRVMNKPNYSGERENVEMKLVGL